VSRKRIIRLMQQQGLKARVRKRFKCTTNSNHDQPVAANLLDRNFEADRPNQKWVGDTTELVTGNGKLFLAVILDLFSKYVVGWSLSPVSSARSGCWRCDGRGWYSACRAMPSGRSAPSGPSSARSSC